MSRSSATVPPAPSSASPDLPRPVLLRPRTDPDGPRLSLSLHWTDDRCVITLVGVLDRSSAVVLVTQFDQFIRAGIDEVVLDLAGLQAVDESGAVALAELWARLRNHGVFCRARGLQRPFEDSPLELLLFVRAAGAGRSGYRTATGRD